MFPCNSAYGHAAVTGTVLGRVCRPDLINVHKSEFEKKRHNIDISI